mmetsp:Transcript_66013/g.123098  ORF Transcript_66013/g.123098 Transcript_66013/m.123098 type:complete len:289 (+) Transcript_66013:74-940(+)
MAWMSSLPVDLVLVRHGESEGNLFDKMKPGGLRQKLHGRHTADFRLTDLGRLQAHRAGKIVMDQIGSFDKMYCSEYIRAIETAAHMDLPESSFNTSTLIREIDSGAQRGLDHPLEEYNQKLDSHFGPGGRWWTPYGGVGGESFADLTLRLRSFLDHLRETATGLRVLVVCHAHVIRGMKALLEDTKGPEFDELLKWEIPNCHVRWYTRRQATGAVHLRPYKVIGLNMEEPHSLEREDSKCVREELLIKRPLMTAAQLRSRAEAVPQLINNSDFQQESPDAKRQKLTPQ